MAVKKSNLKVQNIVATASLGKKVSLTKLAKMRSNTEYNPEQFPGLVLRVAKPKSAVLVFSSGYAYEIDSLNMNNYQEFYIAFLFVCSFISSCCSILRSLIMFIEKV